MNWKKAARNSVVTNTGNMGIYFEEEHEKPRWDSGQAILHRENGKSETRKLEAGKSETRESQKDNEAYRVQNSFGTLRYLKKGKKKDGGAIGREGFAQEGFAIEAFEAPGTPVHTDKEKHLDRRTMKKIRQNDKQALFASETPLRDQALFFDMKGGKKSADFISYLKELLQRQGHQTIEDTFGFLDQKPERMELEMLKAEQKESLTPEKNQLDKELRPEERQETASKRADTLNSRLRRKEAKERQLYNELQLMLDQRTREEFLGDLREHSQNEQETPQKEQEKNQNSDSPQRRQYAEPELSESAPEGEEDTAPDEAPGEDLQ